MTSEQVRALKPGDKVFVAMCSPGIPVRIIETEFYRFWESTKGDVNCDVTSNVGAWNAARVHLTEQEARQDIREILQRRIKRTQDELLNWQD